MIIIPEAIKTLVNAFTAIFAKKEDVKQSNWNQLDESKIDFIRNKPKSVSDDEFLEWLNEAKVVEPVASTSGEVYTTNDNQIYIL